MKRSKISLFPIGVVISCILIAISVELYAKDTYSILSVVLGVTGVIIANASALMQAIIDKKWEEENFGPHDYF